MSFARTYAHTALLALDLTGAALLFNRNDVTISALCRLEQLDRFAPGLGIMRALNLRPWQHTFLHIVGTALDWKWPGHCEDARLGDEDRAKSTLALLGVHV